MTNATTMLAILLRCIYGLLFVASGISKCLRQRSVRVTVARYQLMPARLVPICAYLLAILELLAGVLLLLSLGLPTYPFAWAMTTGLLALFCVVIASALLRGLRIPCGCSVLLNGHTLTRSTLLRNLTLLLPLLLPPFWPLTSPLPSPLTSPLPSPLPSLLPSLPTALLLASVQSVQPAQVPSGLPLVFP